MREIKFRAWDEDENKMYEVQTINFFFGIIELMWWENNVHKSKDDSFNGQINSGEQDFGQYKLMQFTGLKDKNGKEIYAGDIVKHFNTYCNAECIETFEWVHESYGGDPYQDGFDTGFVMGAESKDMEIIGNIYENKELLENIK